MTRSSVRYASVYFPYIFLVILIFGSFQCAQSIALSSLCGQFGHSCFGGNWGKRELSTLSFDTPLDLSQSNLNDDQLPLPISDFERDYFLEQLRLNLIRQRLQTLLEYE